MQGPYTYLLDRPEEILYHLEYGQGYEGEPSYFNLAIDLIFQVQEDNRCPGGRPSNIDLEGPVGIGSDQPPQPEPPVIEEEPPAPNPPPNNF